MVHGNNAVELTALSLGEDTVVRYGTVNIEVAAFQFLDGRNDFLSLLPAEHAVFAAMRIQAGHADVWILNTELAAGIVDEFDALDDAGLLHQVAGLAQGNMR